MPTPDQTHGHVSILDLGKLITEIKSAMARRDYAAANNAIERLDQLLIQLADPMVAFIRIQ